MQVPLPGFCNEGEYGGGFVDYMMTVMSMLQY